MAAETAHTTPDPDGEDLEQYVDQRLFDDSMGTLADHTARKAALSDKRRYAILFLLWGERKWLAKSSLLLSTMTASTLVTTLENSSMLVWSPGQVRPKMVMDDRRSTKSRISGVKRWMQTFEISLARILIQIRRENPQL